MATNKRLDLSDTMGAIGELVKHYAGEVVKGKEAIKNINMELYNADITDKIAYQKTTALNQEIDKLIGTAKDDINTIKNQHMDAERAFQTLNGNDITSDANLLKGDFKFAKDDLIKLADKYKDNYTMSTLIYNYAAEHNILLQHIQSVESVEATLDKFIELLTPRIASAYDDKINSMGTGVDNYLDLYLENAKQRAINSTIFIDGNQINNQLSFYGNYQGYAQ